MSKPPEAGAGCEDLPRSKEFCCIEGLHVPPIVVAPGMQDVVRPERAVAWMVVSDNIDESRRGRAVFRSLDRKVCNALNTWCLVKGPGIERSGGGVDSVAELRVAQQLLARTVGAQSAVTSVAQGCYAAMSRAPELSQPILRMPPG